MYFDTAKLCKRTVYQFQELTFKHRSLTILAQMSAHAGNNVGYKVGIHPFDLQQRGQHTNRSTHSSNQSRLSSPIITSHQVKYAKTTTLLNQTNSFLCWRPQSKHFLWKYTDSSYSILHIKKHL